MPDLRYWTAYDHFMTDYEARVERAAYFRDLIRRVSRKLATALIGLARRASGRVQTVS